MSEHNCRQCNTDISTGYSWNGLCIVCAEPYLERAQFAVSKELSELLEGLVDEFAEPVNQRRGT